MSVKTKLLGFVAAAASLVTPTPHPSSQGFTSPPPIVQNTGAPQSFTAAPPTTTPEGETEASRTERHAKESIYITPPSKWKLWSPVNYHLRSRVQDLKRDIEKICNEHGIFEGVEKPGATYVDKKWAHYIILNNNVDNPLEGRHIRIDHHGIEFFKGATNEGIIIGLGLVKGDPAWNKSFRFKLGTSYDERLRIWLHAQEMGLKVKGWKPKHPFSKREQMIADEVKAMHRDKNVRAARPTPGGQMSVQGFNAA
jgi:hypothetical protein